ncbi:MAG: polysaccharide biosynthesis C-terminal domain-containing protein, partial [Gemmatimonadota bacterium]
LVGYILWHRASPDLSGLEARFPTSVLFRTGRPLFAITALQLVMQWTSTLLLGVWSTTEQVGLYNVAYRTAFIVTLVLSSVNSIAAPKFSELHSRRETPVLAATTRNSTRLMIMLATPALLVLVFAPEFVMSLFGREFRQGWPMLVTLALGQFVNVAAGSVGFLLIMTGEERAYRNVTLFAAFVNVGLNVALIPRLGGLGAAIATATGVAARNLGAVLVVRRKLGIQPIPFSPRWETAGRT